MIQIIGKTGMLGREVVQYCRSHSIEIDDTFVDIVSVRPEDITCSIVVNCSGHAPSSVGCKDKMIAVNQIGPKNLAQVCDLVGARLVHMSTDAVYNRLGPHCERDFCDPSSTYGRTKMIGEIKRSPHLTVRSSFIGIGLRGIVTQLTSTDDTIKASDKFLWNGHTAKTIAGMIVELALKRDVTGLIHIPGEFHTRYDLVMRLVRLFDIDEKRIVRDDSYITDRRLISTRWRSIGMDFPTKLDIQLIDLLDSYNRIYKKVEEVK